MKAIDYLQDGANHQARAVLMFVQAYLNIEGSWDKKLNEYAANVEVSRWYNGREQGYILSIRSKDYNRQLNIAFFEHRNSDNICAVRWEQLSMNPISSYEQAEFGDAYQDKYDVSKSVGYGEIAEMSTYIQDEFNEFWKVTSAKEEEVAD